MAEFSDTVRPGIGQLSALGHPDVRLHLPKHHAIASWTTPEGRQAPFIAPDDPAAGRSGAPRAARRAPARARRTPSHRPPPTTLGSRGSRGPIGAALSTTAGRRTAMAGPPSMRPRTRPRRRTIASAEEDCEPPATPSTAIASSSSSTARTACAGPSALTSAAIARARSAGSEILALVASLRHVLTSQVHRRFNPGRAATTTQRRLKRLSDAGLVERFQFHRRDGGGVPMCYVITAAGVELLSADDRLEGATRMTAVAWLAPSLDLGCPEGEARLRQARHDVHVAGWALALERAPGTIARSSAARAGGIRALAAAAPDPGRAGGARARRSAAARRAGAPRLPAHRRRRARASRWSALRPCVRDAIVEVASGRVRARLGDATTSSRRGRRRST